MIRLLNQFHWGRVGRQAGRGSVGHVWTKGKINQGTNSTKEGRKEGKDKQGRGVRVVKVQEGHKGKGEGGPKGKGEQRNQGKISCSKGNNTTTQARAVSQSVGR